MEEEERRYGAVLGRTLTRDELDGFKAGLAGLIDGERRHEEQVAEALRQVETRRTAVEGAREQAARARRETSKILAHKELWMEEARKEAARLEDLEMEEFRPLPPQGAENDDE